MLKRETIFGVAAGAAMLAAPEALAKDGRGGGPYVTVEHPAAVAQMGGQVKRRVDCGTLLEMQGQLWLTCAFAEQVDSNGQEICADTDVMPNDETGRRNRASIALYKALTHFGRVHGDCVAQAGGVDQRQGRNSDRIYGSSWKDKISCTLVEARDLCRSALELD